MSNSYICNPCRSCCASCSAFPGLPISTSDSPYALKNLLPVGTISFSVLAQAQHEICGHKHSEDGWHWFQDGFVISYLSSPQDISSCREIGFLIKQKFIAATYLCTQDGDMVVRIYLVPYDLKNVRGELRVRKENVLGPGKRYMRSLLPRILQHPDLWQAQHITETPATLLPVSKDSRTLADIYSELPSPRPTSIPDYEDMTSRLLDYDDDLEGLGMRSCLYRYQRRSVAAMLQKELDLRVVPDPLYIPIQTMHGETFYLQPGTTEILLERPMISPCRGGILCEELGTGKTVMMLSLIVATRNQISTPEPSIMDPDRPILTPIAFRHFPSDTYSTARKRFPSNLHRVVKVPSLVEMMLHRARTSPYSSFNHREPAKEEEISSLPLGQAIRKNVPFYHHYYGEPSNRERTHRNRPEPAPRTIYLTSATLIIVPANLLSQWDREIIKHCDVSLRVLILRAKTPVPPIQSLATDYDIILMSYTRFSAESNNRDLNKLHTKSPCTCPEMEGFRIPDCTCQVSTVSPFLQIRWKRLIIDEGHVSSTLSTTLVPFSKLMSVERRWIVTGTPTTNLLGLSLGSRAVESADEAEIMADINDDPTVQSSSSNASSPPSSPGPAVSSSISTPHSSTSGSLSCPRSRRSSSLEKGEQTRTWNKYDREDLNKLGNMITHFIAVPLFTSDPKLISTHVTEPLLDRSGPRFGAIQILNQVMEMVMIRHRIEEVEQDVVLPLVTRESVLLDLDPYVVKSFNALQAIITINAIDSERTDQDYMFHTRNAAYLQETVRNMSQLMFWHVDEGLYNSKQLVVNAQKHIDLAKTRNMSQEDILALEEAFNHLRSALEDPLWRSMQMHEDVPYRIFNLNEEVYKTWTRTPHQEPNADLNQTGFLHADRLLKLYDTVVERPLIKEDKMIEWGEIIAQRDQLQRQAYEESQRQRGQRHRQSGKKSKYHESDPSLDNQMAEKFAKRASAVDTLKEMQRELDITMKRLEREAEMDHGDNASAPHTELGSTTNKRPSMLIASSPFTKLRIGSSASSKLNYIINEVKKYSPMEKFLIFSESALSLAHVAEALELIQVKFLRFTTQVTPQYREQLVLTFETSETYRVFLMELKHGARGLNLISASRVIFCEPVWQADVESQAIKRAHRIGQTKPITVKTLAIRDTAEENMVARKAALQDSQEKLPKVIEEAGMRHYIANPKFINRPVIPTSVEQFPLIQLPPEFSESRAHPIMLKIPALPRTPLKRVRVEDPATEDGLPDIAERISKKKRTGMGVRFAT